MTPGTGTQAELLQGDCSALGTEWDALFDAAPGFQSRRAWFDALTETALAPGTTPLMLAVREAGQPIALLPLLMEPNDAVKSLTTAYTCLFQPLIAPGMEGRLTEAGLAMAEVCRRWPVLILEALDREWPGLSLFVGGLRAGGISIRTFNHFGNWHEPVSEGGWNAYFANRPGSLRETLRRKTRAAVRDAQVRLQIVCGNEGLGPALAAYEQVYTQSWKQPEPAAALASALLPRAAKAGVLRLGLMWVGDQPIAAQYWIVAEGTATVLKLAHDDAWKSLSPGTVLTGHVIRHVIEQDHVLELDFGRGDDPYKQLWVSRRRQRVGLLLANVRRPKGAMALLRHDMGLLARRPWFVRDVTGTA